MNNKLKDETILYTYDSCCGCGGCMQICPKNAITMKTAHAGGVYPKVDTEKCISCRLCIKTCAFQKEHVYPSAIEGYALVNNNKKELGQSASGGAFSAIATNFIKKNNVVCGSVMKYDKKVRAEHMVVTSKDQLSLLYGSKYVYSSLLPVYRILEKYLKNGKKVLFSGTPCQVSQIKLMFDKYKSNLYTIDIICHGTPSEQIFSDYIKFLEKKNAGKVIDFKFRDKCYGWGKYGSVVLLKNGEKQKIDLPQERSSYYTFFMEGNLQRENCFDCPYAKSERCSDLTIGDYWGIEKYQPDILKSNNGSLDEEKGISAVLVNTKKGKELLENIDAALINAKVEDIVLGNSQLRHPVPKGKLYDQIIKAYHIGGYRTVENIFLFKRLKRGIKTYFTHAVKKK